MSLPASRISVFAGEKFACIRIAGRGDFTNSIEFTTLVRELRAAGYSYFVVDLSECSFLDSTFLGALATLGLQLTEDNHDHCESGIQLLNANARIVDLLECLGVIHLFKLAEGPLVSPEPTQSLPHTATKPTKEEVTRACLEAHRTLMEINPANVPRFKDVAQFLAEDLRRIKAEKAEKA
jgi:anti-sigma B factor antagonist